MDWYESLAEVEKKLINQALKKTGGNVYSSAELLGIHTSLIYRKIKFYNLTIERKRLEAKRKKKIKKGLE